ncbi:MAG: bifunctional 2-C-methyl-D-erythritol 4-phosphate cytidylyltransferase/2-C-methyl-D-erythritol 2,4-cyclodiphosphate synthase [Proteobacteria bacterium]|nr:bifunctional 2-C-methyl-D-erythritol 4-phosphate cytidylyltransferase/2-C-methyl-D-erythritol 2,4-cyclodiphosphate synthase [Pseudomonadota bacterium]
MSRIAALIVAAGRGERMGGSVPKQYRELMGKSVLRRAVEVFTSRSDIAVSQVVIASSDRELYAEAVKGLKVLPALGGGGTRQHSVMHGLEALSAHKPDFVLIHDAARPLTSQSLVDRVVAALESGADAAIPLLPVSDTLKRNASLGRWETISRENTWRAQTPQGFRFNAIWQAHREYNGRVVTDDMALAELAGLTITPVDGEETNMKITSPSDLETAQSLLGGFETRTAFGFDSHRFAPGKFVWLCGVKIAHREGLEGHSDADAGLHALTDALLGTIGEGDLGQHFPPADERWRDASSSIFVEHAAKLIAERNGHVVHCDITLICESPKIAPHREAMRARIAEILKIDVSRVSVKATTTEGMGFTGRREGLVAQAVATVALPRT